MQALRLANTLTHWFVVLCDKLSLTMDCVLAVALMVSAAHQAAFLLRFVNVLLILTIAVSSAIAISS